MSGRRKRQRGGWLQVVRLLIAVLAALGGLQGLAAVMAAWDSLREPPSECTPEPALQPVAHDSYSHLRSPISVIACTTSHNFPPGCSEYIWGQPLYGIAGVKQEPRPRLLAVLPAKGAQMRGIS